MDLNKDLIKKYNQSGPRYTSYPPSNHFKTLQNNQKWVEMLKLSNQHPGSISLYFHIPFCPKRCSYCGCNTEIGAPGNIIREYQDMILKEMELTFPYLDKNKKVSQIHFGGGTPNAVPVSYLEEILNKVLQRFSLTPNYEMAIECDPNFLSLKRLKEFKELGFNRISYGLQDFNSDVLKSVNRKFPSVHPQELISEARNLGFKGINLDLIYGLPKQSRESFQLTLQETIKVKPDRIAVFSYAHLPKIMPHQLQLEQNGLPSAETKLDMLIDSHELLNEAGFSAIGMDHFAKSDDSLCRAKEEGNLHRNFQGYCTKETTGQVYAFGMSGISQLTDGFGQNIKDINKYIESISQGNIPVEKYYQLNREEKINRKIIMSIMCKGKFDVDEISTDLNMDQLVIKERFDEGISEAKDLFDDNMIQKTENGLKITELGWLFVRCIAMLFDPMLSNKQNSYSRTI